MKREFLRLLDGNLQLDVPVPGIIRRLPRGDFRSILERRRRLSTNIEVHPQPIRGLAVDVPAEGGKESRRGRWAAGDFKPSLTLELSIAGERRGVAEGVPFQGHTREDRIVEGLLQQVHVPPVARQLKHTVVPQDHAG